MTSFIQYYIKYLQGSITSNNWVENIKLVFSDVKNVFDLFVIEKLNSSVSNDIKDLHKI